MSDTLQSRLREQERLMRASIAILTLSGLFLPCANAQEVSAKQQMPRPLSGPPRSGALVGLNSGQTLWIAPIGDKIQVFAAPDYIIPRRDGFWRVRLDVNWNDPMLSGVPPGHGRLWAVPLKKGMDAVAWPAEQPVTSTSEEENKQEESIVEAMQREADKEGHHIEPLFLSPDYLSLYDAHTEVTSGGSTRGSTTYAILKITDPPETPSRTTEQLLVEEIHVPIPDDTRDKDLKACVRADDTLSDSDKDWALGQETTLGIRRDRHRWIYSWLMGGGAGLSCPVSIPPPKNIVGNNEMFPDWKLIKSTFPGAEDAFSSPSHDLLLIMTDAKLIVAPVRDGKIGKSLGEITLTGKPVMVQWAIGRYVDAWTNELTQYFDAYHM